MTRTDRAKKTRRLILESAGTLFAQRGYSGTTVYDIYSRVGVTKGAFYFHFATKAELAEAVLAGQPGRGTYPLVPRRSKLQELVDADMVLACDLAADPIVQGGLRMSLDLLGQADGGIDSRLPLRRWIDQNRNGLQRAKECLELQPQVDVRETAELLVGAFLGVQLLSHAVGRRRDLPARISVLLSHVLSSVATAEVLAGLELGGDRGARVIAELARQTVVRP